MNEIQKRLFSMQDIKYKDFSQRLMPTVEEDTVIGVRTPDLRKYAGELYGTAEAEAFIKNTPHKYYEENNLHAYIIEKIKDYDTALFETKRFLPCIDNWATCDTFIPKVFKKSTVKLLPEVMNWLDSSETYTVRYGIGILMRLYLDEHFSPEFLERVAEIKSGEYYINMMIAWYFATALAKQYDAAIGFITDNRLDIWVHNKTIQKAIESYRISEETKDYLRGMKR